MGLGINTAVLESALHLQIEICNYDSSSTPGYYKRYNVGDRDRIATVCYVDDK